jgi:uncharacterized membrane protein
MEMIKTSIDVHRPLRTVYNQWTQFESFPEFMSGVKEVRQIDDSHVRWHAEIWGKDKEWIAEITEQVPNEYISWKTLSGAPNVGTVRFEPVSAKVTRVHLAMAYEPEGAIEHTGDAMGLVNARVKETIEDFKTFIESHYNETGSWRGSIREGRTRTEK